MPKLYMDSCILIYLIQSPEKVFNQIYGKLVSLSPLESQICVSELTRLECRVGPLMENDQFLLKQFDDFFSYPKIKVFPFNRETFNLATEIRSRLQIKNA